MKLLKQISDIVNHALARIREERQAREDADQHFANLAISKGTMGCPHCEDQGPHEDNGGLGRGLAFRCRRCRSLFKVDDYEWERAG